MRVISGEYKSIKLNSLEGMNTRPTTDKVKESIFNMIDCLDKKSLDLFSGTGSLGIEALSRGGEKTIFIDLSKEAIKIIYSNLEKCKIQKKNYEVYKNDFIRAIKILAKKEEKFDLIFLDPPYNKKIIDKALKLILENNLCNNECLIVCEKSNIDKITYENNNLKIIKEKNYGYIDVVIYKYQGEQSE